MGEGMNGFLVVPGSMHHTRLMNTQKPVQTLLWVCLWCVSTDYGVSLSGLAREDLPGRKQLCIIIPGESRSKGGKAAIPHDARFQNAINDGAC